MPRTKNSTTERSLSAYVIPSGSYVADPARSRLSFRAKAFGLIWVHGQMPAMSGTIHVIGDRLRGAGEVAADNVSTGLPARDWHLRTKHYLHTRQHPTIQLSVDDADIASGCADARVVVRGNPATVRLELDSVQASDRTLRLEAHGTIDRTPFGMLPPTCGVSRLVHVQLTVVATPAQTSGTGE